MSNIKKHITAVIDETTGVSDIIDATDYLNMLVNIPSTFTGYLAAQILKADEETFEFLRDSGRDGTTLGAIADIDQPSGGWTNYAGWYMLPAELYAAQYIRLIAHDGSGNAQAQSADISIEILAKGLT